MTVLEITICLIAVVGSAIIKNGVGVGAGIFLLPFLALVFPPKLALGLGAPAMLISDLVGVKNYWREWDIKVLKLLLPLALAGVVFGCYLIEIMPDTLFKQLVGVFAIVFSSYNLLKVFKKPDSEPVKPDSDRTNDHTDSKWRDISTVLYGFVVGVAGTVAHAAGLMMSVYMIHKDDNPRVFVGTLVLFFAVMNIAKLTAYANIGIISYQTIILVCALSPAIILGGYMGNAMNKKIPQELFRMAILVFILLIGVRLLWTA
ncbi:MAG: sulfite exporter TauE/SafE family protein [Desulfobacterales bacterium]|nr:sulfite exporter TauE/SafE family protein [Desulfobacterales bacterium]